jgi:hypothetical protein
MTLTLTLTLTLTFEDIRQENVDSEKDQGGDQISDQPEKQ